MSNKKIIFVGGVHGVGKGTLCTKYQEKYLLKHLSASSIIKSQDTLAINKNSKKVFNVNHNQELLIKGIKQASKQGECFILDGHFTLMNQEKELTRLDSNIFRQIDLAAICVLYDEPILISQRLAKRDNRQYTEVFLEQMQNLEINHGRFIANKLGIEFVSCRPQESDALDRLIQKNLPTGHGAVPTKVNNSN